jgi:hypothetical protein
MQPVGQPRLRILVYLLYSYANSCFSILCYVNLNKVHYENNAEDDVEVTVLLFK